MPVYESSIRSGSITATTGTYNVVFNTGNTPAVFIARNVSFAGLGFIAEVYEAPTGVTGGTAGTILNTDQVNPGTPKGVITYGATVGGVGTRIAAPTYYRGSGSSNPNQVAGTFGASAGSRRLKPNTVYLLQFTNNDAAAQTLDVYLRWYEGADPTPF